MFMKSGLGAIAQSKGPGLVQLYHTCVGSNLERDIVFHLSLSLRGKKVIFLSSCRGIGVKKKFVEKNINPSHAICAANAELSARNGEKCSFIG